MTVGVVTAVVEVAVVVVPAEHPIRVKMARERRQGCERYFKSCMFVVLVL
jgi:hypothetical protein